MSIQIIDTGLKFTNQLVVRAKTDKIVLHHSAGTGSVEEIHNLHIKSNGWSGIGYHLYIRRDGTVYRGRPIDKVGAHCLDHNYYTIGICFEGNFETGEMSDNQFSAGREVIKYLKELYPNAEFCGHRDLNATSCPGKNFPLEQMIKEDEEMKPEEIYNAYNEYASAQPMPDWGEAYKAEYEAAIALGITDGTSPMMPIPRHQAAVMALRAAKMMKGVDEHE